MSFSRTNTTTSTQQGTAPPSTSAAASLRNHDEHVESNDETFMQKKRPSDIQNIANKATASRCNASWVWQHTTKLKKLNKLG